MGQSDAKIQMTDDSLITYPCDFPIKVMGISGPLFSDEIIALVQQHAPDFDAATVECRSSRAGNYLSLTCTLRAQSREQLDNVYRALTAHPHVKMVL